MNINNSLDVLMDMFRVANATFYGDQLPEPIILIQSGGKKAKDTLGWFTSGKTWIGDEDERHEITVVAEHLKRPLEEIFTTILHEVNHLSNKLSGVRDTSGRYHNKRFRDTASNHGLNVEYEDGIGWSVSSLNQQGLEAFYTLKIDPTAFGFARKLSMATVSAQKSKRHHYACPSCGTKISSKEEVNATCRDCGCDFEPEEK